MSFGLITKIVQTWGGSDTTAIANGTGPGRPLPGFERILYESIPPVCFEVPLRPSFNVADGQTFIVNVFFRVKSSRMNSSWAKSQLLFEPSILSEVASTSNFSKRHIFLHFNALPTSLTTSARHLPPMIQKPLKSHFRYSVSVFTCFHLYNSLLCKCGNPSDSWKMKMGKTPLFENRQSAFFLSHAQAITPRTFACIDDKARLPTAYPTIYHILWMYQHMHMSNHPYRRAVCIRSPRMWRLSGSNVFPSPFYHLFLNNL